MFKWLKKFFQPVHDPMCYIPHYHKPTPEESCEAGKHSYGKWVKVGYSYQERSCMVCGLIMSKRI